MNSSTRQIIPPRELTAQERHLIEYLLSKPFPGRSELLEQLNSARVSEEYLCCASVVLSVDQRSSHRAPVKRRIPVEAEGVEHGGVVVHVLLHVVDGFLSELETYAEDSEPVKELPDPRSLEIIILD